MRIVFAMASKLSWELEQLDVQTAFLCADIDTDLYMYLPEGFKHIKSNPDRDLLSYRNPVLKLIKAIYDIKQAPRLWNKRLTSHLKKMGFTRCEYDHSLWIRNRVLILVYFDDLLVAGPSTTERRSVKKELFREFAMTDAGPVAFFLGMHVHRRTLPDGKVRFGLSQRNFKDTLLAEYNMSDANPALTPLPPGGLYVRREHEHRYAPAKPKSQTRRRIRNSG